MDQSPLFTREDIEPTTTEAIIGHLQNLKAAQLLNIKGYVNCLTPVKTVTQKSNQTEVDVRECQLTDHTGSVKLVLWGKFTTKVENGQTYQFVNLRLKSANAKLHLSTTQTGCTIAPAAAIPNIDPPKELPTSMVTELCTINCISKLSSYNACLNCNKKIAIAQEKIFVNCDNCHASMHKRKCNKVFYAKILVANEKDHKLPLTFFGNSIRQIIDVYNNVRGEAHSLVYAELSEDDIMEAILELDQIHITYDCLKVITVTL
jgi:hypothetical protein